MSGLIAAALERDGFTTAELLDRDEIDRLTAAWGELGTELKAWPFSATILSRDPGYRTRVDSTIRAVFEPRVAGVLPDSRLAYASFVAKRPDDSSAVPIHQDPSFIDEDCFLAVNVWVPLVDVDERNGCLRVLRGSHRLNRAPRGTDFRVPYLEHIDDDDFEPVPLPAGTACLMAGPLYHRSGPNRSSRERVAAAALAVPASAQVRYLYAEPGAAGPRRLEVFDVPDAFYCRHMLGTRPSGLEPVAIERREAEPLSRDEVRARLSGHRAPPDPRPR